jgi:hypothetical protein
VGAAAPAAAGGYVLAAAGGFWHADDDGALRELAQPEGGRTDVRMNDGIYDLQGRFWAGTMAYDETPGAGRLYRLELDGSCTLVLDGLSISNGMGWSPDGATMYLADSGTGDAFAFAFDPSGGALDQQNVRTCRHPRRRPRGVDRRPRRRRVGRVVERRCFGPLRPRRVAARGGAGPGRPPDLLRLRRQRRVDAVRHTSREGLDSAALARQPQAGYVLCIDGLGVAGPPCTPYRGPVIPS